MGGYANSSEIANVRKFHDKIKCFVFLLVAKVQEKN